MKVRVLEVRENEFVEHLKRMLNDTYRVAPVTFDVNYFIGEDVKGKKGLCFILSSSKAGSIYEKFTPLQMFETPLDIEDGFVSQIINDLVLAGVTFVNLERMRMSDFLRKGKKPIRHVIYLN